MSLTKATYSMVNGAPANILDFGAVGNGTTDDTAAINAALAANKSVVVPSGLTCLISSTIAIPPATKLYFEGGTGNTATDKPASYFIKSASMTTVGITLSGRSIMEGGGLVCQVGNTGDGIQIIGNDAKLFYSYVSYAGSIGVRVGTTGGANVNSFELNHINCYNNTGDGIYIHDGTAATGANANAGTLYSCISSLNGGSGFNLGHCFWVQVINGLAESNVGWGLFLSGTANNTYPECRWPSIIGGDYNEGNNTGGLAGQVADYSYFASFLGVDGNSIPTNAGNGLQGSGSRNTIGSQKNYLTGLSVAGSPLSIVLGNSIAFPTTTPTNGAKTSNNLSTYEEGTWTPAQGGGLTLVGAFSSSGFYTRIGRMITITGLINGATSVAVTGGGLITNNLPYAQGYGIGIGSMTNYIPNSGTQVEVVNANLYSAGAISATPTIAFSATYFV